MEMEKIIGTVDPGHGGDDNHNVGASKKYYEHIGVLTISQDLKAELESTGAFKIFLTRDKDVTLGLTERGKIAAANKSDFFISEHTNAGPSDAGGTEVYYSVDLPETKDLAAALSANVSSTLGIKDRGARVRESINYPGEDYYTVIDSAQDNGVPKVFIVESAFHSNPAEEQKLLDRETLRNIAKAQAKAICAHYKVQYPVVAPAPQPTPVPKPQPAPVKPVNQSVVTLQKNLNRLKIAKLAEDGSYGSATTAAVKIFQSLAGISVDGHTGPQTQTALDAVFAKPLCKDGVKGSIAVRYIQWRVGAGVDGNFGPQTKSLVATWQKRNGLVGDAVVGPNTWKVLIG